MDVPTVQYMYVSMNAIRRQKSYDAHVPYFS